MSELERMEIMMQEMSGQMLAMQEFIKEQSLEITALKKGSKGTMSTTESVISNTRNLSLRFSRYSDVLI